MSRRAVAALVLAGLSGMAGPAPAAGTAAPSLRTAERTAAALEAQVDVMRQSAERYADWQACLRPVPVSEYGSPRGTSGYRYDARDGTGPGYAPALAVDVRSAPGRSDYVFLALRGDGACSSAAAVPGGTADAARRSAARAQRRPAAPSSPLSGLARLERRVAALRRLVRGLERSAADFDGWESCVSWVPVSEHGDPLGGFGYLYGRRGGPSRYRPALAVDRSDQDDPDYRFLAFVGADRPGRACRDEPGEAVDRGLREATAPVPATKRRLRARAAKAGRPSAPGRLREALQDLDALGEDVSDLREPVAAFDLFDQCMFTIGVSAHGRRDGSAGYVFGRERRPALALDLDGAGPAAYDFLGFPAEEPPGIECNEDAQPEQDDG